MAKRPGKKQKPAKKARRQQNLQADDKASKTTSSTTAPSSKSNDQSNGNELTASIFTLSWLLRRSPRRGALIVATVLTGVGLFLAIGTGDLALDPNATPPNPWFAREINPDMRLQRFNGIRDVEFYDDLNGVVVGFEGLFATTMDGGLTWATPQEDWSGLILRLKNVQSEQEALKLTAAGRATIHNVSYQTPTESGEQESGDRLDFQFEEVVLTGPQSGFVRAVLVLRQSLPADDTAPGEIPPPPKPFLGSLVLPIENGRLLEPPWLEQLLNFTHSLQGRVQRLVATGPDSWKAWGSSGLWSVEWDGKSLTPKQGGSAPMAETPVVAIPNGFVELTRDKLVIQVEQSAGLTIPLPSKIHRTQTGVRYVQVSAIPGRAGNSQHFDQICIVAQWWPDSSSGGSTGSFSGMPEGRLAAEFDDWRAPASLTAHLSLTTQLFLTRDNGASWRVLSASGLDLDNIGRITGLHFFSPTSGCLTTRNGDLFRTVDRGETWSQLNVSGSASFVAMTAQQVLGGANRAWAAREDGTIIRSVDSGATWKHVTLPVTPLCDVQFSTFARTGIATGRNRQLLVTRDSGRNWQRHQLDTGWWAESAAFVDDTTAVVVGNGILHRTTDGGNSWLNLQRDSDSGLYLDVEFPTADTGIIVGADGILRSTDRGVTWDKVSVPRAWLYGVDSADDRRVVAVGENGLILYSTDGGSSWQSVGPTLPERAVPSRHLRDAKLLPSGVGWAVGDRGWLVTTMDFGETWTEQSLPTAETLLRVDFRDAQHGFIVGHAGTLLTTNDGGRAWSQKSLQVNGERIDAALATVHFADELTGYISGQDETLLKSEDGGLTWKHARQYQQQIPPLSYVCFGLACLLIAVSPKLPGPSPDSLKLGDVTPPEAEELWNLGRCLSDGPVEDAENDFLNFEPVAYGLADYIAHESTEPPLTVAITGEWGSGKSSLMNLLADHVRRRKRPVVEFNAWHFQNEENLLTALLESIRRKGIPNFWSLEGLRFRLRLIRERVRRRWTVLAVLCFMWTTFFMYLERNVADWRTEPAKSVNRLADRVDNWWSHDAASLYRACLSGALGLSGLGGGGGTLLVVIRTLRAFGVSPGRLGQEAGNEREAGRRVQFREVFQLEFKDVSRALKPNVMVIFIDDLDRCRPENVMTVLQAVNFLASSGECIVVFGMAIHRVREAVALARSRELSEADGSEVAEVTPQEFAADYMEKLVQIEVPVPRSSDAQTSAFISRVIEGHASTTTELTEDRALPMRSAIREAEERRERKTRERNGRITRYATATSAVLLGMLIAPSLPAPDFLNLSDSTIVIREPDSAELELPGESATLRLALAKSPQLTGILKEFNIEVEKAPPSQEPQKTPSAPPLPEPKVAGPTATFSPVPDVAMASSIAPRSDDGHTIGPWEVTLAVLLTVLAVIVVMSQVRLMRPLPIVKDSDAFKAATREWLSLVSADERRPRYLKRFVNQVRLHAMLSGDERDEKNDEFLVGLNALYVADSSLEELDEDTQDFRNDLQEEMTRLLASVWTTVADENTDIETSTPKVGTIAHGLKRRHADIARFCRKLPLDYVSRVKWLRKSVRMGSSSAAAPETRPARRSQHEPFDQVPADAGVFATQSITTASDAPWTRRTIDNSSRGADDGR